MTERAMATIRTIDAIEPIENADKIEVAKIGGWEVVVGKGDFSSGDKVIYFEIDSALPLDDARFSHLAARGSRIINDKPYHVLRTIRLRGIYSQGLVMPYHEFAEEITYATHSGGDDDLSDGLDREIGVFKWEPPVPVSIGGQVAGGFISGAPKTDAKRVQNLSEGQYAQLLEEGRWIATEKIDGISGTFYNDPDKGIRAASRNWELKESEDQVHWKMVDKYDLQNTIPQGWVVQGEVAGPGIQKNRLALKEVSLFVFRVLDDAGRDVPRILWPEEIKSIAAPVYDGLKLPPTVGGAVEQVNGIKSLVTPGRLTEGVVYWDKDGREFSFLGRPGFKAISNKYLERSKD